MVGSVLVGCVFGMAASVMYLITGGSVLKALLVYSSVGACAVLLIPFAVLLVTAVRLRVSRNGAGYQGGLQGE